MRQATCAADLRKYCNASGPLHTRALLYGLTGCGGPAATNLTFGWTELAELEQDVANFLLVRGAYAWLSAGWSDCSQKIGWSTKHLDADYGRRDLQGDRAGLRRVRARVVEGHGPDGLRQLGAHHQVEINFVFRRRHNRLFHSKESSLPIGFLNFRAF